MYMYMYTTPIIIIYMYMYVTIDLLDLGWSVRYVYNTVFDLSGH